MRTSPISVRTRETQTYASTTTTKSLGCRATRQSATHISIRTAIPILMRSEAGESTKTCMCMPVSTRFATDRKARGPGIERLG